MTVELRAVVDTLGFVEPGSIEVLPSGAPAALSDPVIEELRNRRYTPAKLEGRPVRVRIEVRIKIPAVGASGRSAACCLVVVLAAFRALRAQDTARGGSVVPPAT